MTHSPDQDLLKKIEEKQERILKVLDCPDGRQMLADLEEHFETHLPVFQGKAGSFDPLDAMRRDAYREVFLYCRRQMAKATQRPNPNH